MDRLAEQIVAWHNRHPLARRIAVGDVHTIGVVALPFLRASAQASGLVEPVLTEAVSFDELAAAPPKSRGSLWMQRLLSGLRRLRVVGRPRTQWRAFNEKFLAGLSPAQVERFALACGYSEPPAAPEARPWRVIVIDEKLANAHSGWPFEIYLMTAGIDVGSSRTRILSGRGIPSQVIGRRLLDPKRLAAAAGVVVVLAGAAAAGWYATHRSPAENPPAALPPAASAPAAMASAADPGPASAPALAASAPASAPEPAASAVAEAAPAAPTEPAASDAPPDIRPRLVQRADGRQLPPLRSSKPEDKAAASPALTTPEKPTDKPAEKASDKASPGRAETPTTEPADPRLARLAQAPPNTVVALVGPPGSKAEAEAMLKRMRAGLVGVHNNPDALQGDVIQTPEGWRATVWPFPSREQAQLINATLIARGMKTRAINF